MIGSILLCIFGFMNLSAFICFILFYLYFIMIVISIKALSILIICDVVGFILSEYVILSKVLITDFISLRLLNHS